MLRLMLADNPPKGDVTLQQWYVRFHRQCIQVDLYNSRKLSPNTKPPLANRHKRIHLPFEAKTAKRDAEETAAHQTHSHAPVHPHADAARP